jgi:hypothetical protein
MCTRDLCCQDNGCYFAPICCDDNNACTVDSCDPKSGCQNVKISCDDGDPCTIDRCHCDQGCQYFPVDHKDHPECVDWKPEECKSDADCQDKSACTVNSCKEGSCHKKALDCDDNDMCTIDSCHHLEGCQYEKISGCGDQDVPHKEGIIVHDSEVTADGVIIHDLESQTLSDDLLKDNESTHNEDKVLGAGPIAGIVVGVVALVAIVGLIGYKVTQKPTVADNSYASM